MSSVSRTTSRHLRYASGYVGLEMFTEAAGELSAIPFEEWTRPEVVSVRIDLHMARKEWEMVAELGQKFARNHPEFEQGWISWAYALRELNRITEAKAVLLEAESRHWERCAVLNYNLACYHCLLGERDAARRRLRKACQMDRTFKEHALTDPDLQAMRDEIPQITEE